MVARITFPKSINRTLNYNEEKVEKGQAECIHAGNFLQDVSDMNLYDKRNRFQNLIELNTRAKKNTLHISLNFDPSEILSREKLIEIASVYMQKIGFATQPYLVYQHKDAGHPHVHIVTTTIQEKGKRIETFNIGPNQSEKARKEIEETYGLIRASGRSNSQKESAPPMNVQKIKYGLSETKRSITNVLALVLNQYKFTSLPELNAVLKLYNVAADRGSEEGRIYKNRGLIYRVLDEAGNKVGVPIKASSIYFKPTLNFLEKKFEENVPLRVPFESKLKAAINWTIAKKPGTPSEFISQLQKEKVDVVSRQNEQGFIYGITFVDHRTKTVFDSSDLGEQYTAASIQQRILRSTDEQTNRSAMLLEKPNGKMTLSQKDNRPITPHRNVQEALHERLAETNSNTTDLLQFLMNKERAENRILSGLIKKNNKRPKPKV